MIRSGKIVFIVSYNVGCQQFTALAILNIGHVASLLAADVEHEIVDDERPKVRVLVLAEVAAHHVLEFYDHAPGVFIDALLVLGLLKVFHELLVEGKAVLQVDAPDVLRHVERNSLRVGSLLHQVEHKLVDLLKGVPVVELLAQLRHAAD